MYYRHTYTFPYWDQPIRPMRSYWDQYLSPPWVYTTTGTNKEDREKEEPEFKTLPSYSDLVARVEALEAATTDEEVDQGEEAVV